MHWGLSAGDSPPVLLTENAAAFFTFSMGDGRKPNSHLPGNDAATSKSPDAMLFFAAGATPPKSENQSTAFRVTLCASQGVLNDLFSSDGANNFAQARLQIAQNESSHIEINLTPSARFNLESIRRCPFAGAFREIALAARGLDLLTSFITALDDELQPASTDHAPLDHTFVQIRAAAARLQANLEQPPSIAVLASAVGLSESTLKRGFRQLYNTTPFGYLRTRRMDHARELLATGKTTVLEAAAYVGYSNPSNFAAAFKKQFGVNPKTFQMATRR